jgi:hypothetical protein
MRKGSAARFDSNVGGRITLKWVAHKVARVAQSVYWPGSDSQQVQNFSCHHSALGGPRWRSWLRHCATNRQVAGSIPDGVIGIYHWHNPVGRTMAMGSTQPPVCWGVLHGDKVTGEWGNSEVKNVCSCTYISSYIFIRWCLIKWRYFTLQRYAVIKLVEALRYNPEGRGFDSR